MLKIIIGSCLLLVAAISLIPRRNAVDGLYTLLRAPYLSMMRGLGFRVPEWQYDMSRRIARVWMPALLLLSGILLVLGGILR
jgi:hypothetical protein